MAQQFAPKSWSQLDCRDMRYGLDIVYSLNAEGQLCLWIFSHPCISSSSIIHTLSKGALHLVSLGCVIDVGPLLW
jgi:hypothetical protein